MSPVRTRSPALFCRCSSGVERFLGKEEVTGSNPVIGSTDNQQVTKELSISKIILANYERTFACISLFLFLSIQSVKIKSYRRYVEHMLYISNLSEQLEKKMLKSDRIVPPQLYI